MDRGHGGLRELVLWVWANQGSCNTTELMQRPLPRSQQWVHMAKCRWNLWTYFNHNWLKPLPLSRWAVPLSLFLAPTGVTTSAFGNPLRQPWVGMHLAGVCGIFLWRSVLLAFPGVGRSSVATNYPPAQRKHVEVKKKQDLWYEPEMNLQTGSIALGSPQQLSPLINGFIKQYIQFNIPYTFFLFGWGLHWSEFLCLWSIDL